MEDLELPLGTKRTKAYRFFELVPALLSYGAIIVLFILSFLNPLLAAAYLMLIIITLLVKAIGIAFHTLRGHNKMVRAQKVNWHERLMELEDPVRTYEQYQTHHRGRSRQFGAVAHHENLRFMAADPASFPKPSQLYNAVIVPIYKETLEVVEPTVESLISTTYDSKHIILVLAYEAQGGEATENMVRELERRYQSTFRALYAVKHVRDLSREVVGKGGNITHAGRFLETRLKREGIDLRDVIVTTLDSDNRPHTAYFDYLTYEYIVHEDRKHLSYQPISLFLNNIWDAPAPMRVVATGNSFWNIISSMRPHTLRNFASHAQPMEALAEMDFWSTRSIVEDGHQYWRSYFYFDGNYAVVPLYVPIYQDAVLSDTYFKTLKAQFVQLSRWAYGVSDIPYVATRIFSRSRKVPLAGGLGRLLRLVDGHVTLACVSLLIAFGGWVPLLINPEAARRIEAQQLPEVISGIQQVALVGLLITVFLSLKMLPPRPERYKRRRTLWMLLQWFYMPFTSIFYSSASAFYSQTRLFLGKYMEVFAVTDKATHQSRARAKQSKASRGAGSKS